MKKCVACDVDSEVVTDGKDYCIRHYVEAECKECLYWQAVSITESVKTNQATEKSKRILAEILRAYPNILCRENEFGEHVSEEELAAITERFRKLRPEQIDGAYHRCGYVFANHDKDFKALRKSDIAAILGGFGAAKEKIWNLLCESHIGDVKKALEEQEKLAGFGIEKPI